MPRCLYHKERLKAEGSAGTFEARLKKSGQRKRRLLIVPVILLAQLAISCNRSEQQTASNNGQIAVRTTNNNNTISEVHMATREEVKNALKERIRRDDPNNFKEAIWNNVSFGVYYDGDDELVDCVVFETTDELVKREGRYLPTPVWQGLIQEVGPDNTPEQALTPMMVASQRAEALPANGEGPNAGRPRQRPTLRGAR